MRFAITNDGSVAMSNNNQNNWDDDEEDFDLEDTRTVDTDLVKQLRKAERMKEKRIKELEAELTNFRTSQRESIISQVLESKGVNPKVAKFIPQDIEPSATAVESWVQEYGDVFGIQQEQSNNEQAPSLAALRQIDSVVANAQTPAGTSDMALKIQNASEEELIAMIHNAGGGYGS